VSYPPEWEAAARRELRGQSPDILVRSTLDGLQVRPLYTRADLADLPHLGFVPAEAAGWRIRCQQDHPVLPEGFEALALLLGPGSTVADLPEPGAAALALVAPEQPLPALALARARGFTGPLNLVFDPLGEAVAGRARSAPQQAYQQAARVLAQDPEVGLELTDRAWCQAGASPLQGLAFTLAAALDLLRALDGLGLDPAAILPRLSLSLGLSPQLASELARLRAARLLWEWIASVLGAPLAPLALHLRSGEWWRSACEPITNLVRTALEAFVASAAGCRTLTLAPFDELAEATATGLRLARNQQLLARHEAHLDFVADPVAGSFFIESLTDQTARATWEKVREIEAAGGLAAALREGRLQSEVEEMARRRQERLARCQDSLVGTNRYAEPEEAGGPPGTDTSALQGSGSGTAGPRPGGCPPDSPALQRLAREGSLGAALEAARAGASLGQMAEALGPGRPLSVSTLAPSRASQSFEDLRRRAAGLPPALVLALGAGALPLQRQQFAADFLHCAGLATEEPPPAPTPEAAARLAAASPARLVVLGAADGDYPAALQALRAAGCQALVALAASSTAEIAGVEFLLRPDSDRIEVLGALLERLRQYEPVS
jgi:methylmalonyl-CoA mutase